MSAFDFNASDLGPNSGYIKDLYELYQQDPSLVGDSWQRFFAGLENGSTAMSVPATGEHNGATQHSRQQASLAEDPLSGSDVEIRAALLLDAFRRQGHYRAKINPLSRGVLALPRADEIDSALKDVSRFFDREVTAPKNFGGDTVKFAALAQSFETTYCSTIGFEYSHLRSLKEREYLEERIEGKFPKRLNFSHQERREILKKIIAAEYFCVELHRRYVGHKRFSIQGGETTIPMIDHIINRSAALGAKEIVLGMAHRGRLNVLRNIMGKPIPEILAEFEDQSIFSVMGSGDVKYHMGYESLRETLDGSLKLYLAPNPSHLEFVNPVVEGIVRARQDLNYQGERNSVLPVLIHGDAAFIGQGIVFETLNLGGVLGYSTGGTIHLVINNQIGFTSTPEEARSTTYCSDVAKGFDMPVFHVNCEDVEGSIWASNLALEFRQTFGKDVVLDLYCFRKYGHNEGDDPSFTQPVMYSEIKNKKTITEVYGEQLISAGELTRDELDGLILEYRNSFGEAYDKKGARLLGETCSVHGMLRVRTPETGVPHATLEKVSKRLITYPDNFVPHPKLQQILEKRAETLKTDSGIDWGLAEALAFGALLLKGHPVRLSGQDCGRGTFSQRHLTLNHFETDEQFVPLSLLKDGGTAAPFEVYNSILSEAAVMGFEFGYSSSAPKSLVLWEGQFGDFANGAQVIIDQFIASSEAKWHTLSGVVLLLPHGYEGQGPEHSSARLERYLQLCGDGNMVVCSPSTPAQYFHLLMRQGIMELKRPLIVMTPKSLLRHPEATSKNSQLTSGQFQTIIEDDFGSKKSSQKIVLCTGKVYYDLLPHLRKLKSESVKVIRVEQLYPFPQFELKKALKESKEKSCIWVQEEPMNMGAWTYMEPYIRGKLELEPKYVGRPVSASTATGSSKRHAAEQEKIVSEMLAHFSK